MLTRNQGWCALWRTQIPAGVPLSVALSVAPSHLTNLCTSCALECTRIVRCEVPQPASSYAALLCKVT
jgi:hypothetical protein